jgi:hypothetical protein
MSPNHRSVEEWTARCLYSQSRADLARYRASKRRGRRKDTMIGLMIGLWAGVMLLVGYVLAHVLVA